MIGKNLKRMLCIVLACLMVLSMAACSNNESGKQPDNTQQAAEPNQSTIIVALPSEPVGLVGSQVGTLVSNIPICNMCEGLITVTPDGEYVPLLAESYEQVDEVTYRFHLKKGVKFHNGEEMKAEDVVYSLQQAALSPVVKHASAYIDPDGLEIEDDYTVLVRTLGPYSPIIACLSHSANSIVSKKAWEEGGEDFVRSPVGTGPFKFVSWTSGEQIEMERFDDYHGEQKAKSDKLIFRIMPEAASRVVELETGGVDVIGDVPATDLLRLKEDTEKFTVYAKPGMRIYPFVMNQQSEFFADKTVRQAMRYATDVDSMIAVVWEGAAAHVDTIMPPAVMCYSDNVTKYEYNVEKAKELLSQAGYPDGFTCRLVTSEASMNVQLSEMLQAQWALVGVTVDITQSENAAWLTQIGNLEFDVTMSPTNNSVGDPDANFTKMFMSSNIGTSGNYAAYNNPEVDELITMARATSVMEERASIYEKAQQIIADDAVWIPAGVPELQVVTRSCVKGFDLYANNTQRYVNVYKE